MSKPDSATHGRLGDGEEAGLGRDRRISTSTWCSQYAAGVPKENLKLTMARPLYVLILAGGSGERFWPLSRKSRPKQLLSLFSEETLLEATLRRLGGLVSPDQILILTNADQESRRARALPRSAAGRISSPNPPSAILPRPSLSAQAGSPSAPRTPRWLSCRPIISSRIRPASSAPCSSRRRQPRRPANS